MHETCRVLWHNKFWIFDASSWLFYTEFVTMHGHLNIKFACVIFFGSQGIAILFCCCEALRFSSCRRRCQMTHDLLVQPQKEERTPVSAAWSAFTRADESRDADVAGQESRACTHQWLHYPQAALSSLSPKTCISLLSAFLRFTCKGPPRLLHPFARTWWFWALLQAQ
jgi:hypothetical protein